MIDFLNWLVKVSGDAVGGWHVEIHDGDNFKVHNPDAPDADAARQAGIDAHTAMFFPEEVGIPAQQETAGEVAFRESDPDAPQPASLPSLESEPTEEPAPDVGGTAQE